MDDNIYKSDFSVVLNKQDPSILPKGDKPNYPSMLRDGVLTGMILLGANIGNDLPKYLDEYRLYLYNNNYHSSQATTATTELNHFVPPFTLLFLIS